MNIEEFRNYCLAKKGVEEDFPFDDVTLTFKVMGKIFAITGLESADDFRVNLKCDPEKSIELREEYEDIIPGWHMNKKHWNTVMPQQGLDGDLIKEFIDHSYELVVTSLPRRVRDAIAG